MVRFQLTPPGPINYALLAGRRCHSFLVTRIGAHFVAFHLFHYAGTGDLLNGWLPMARAVLEGQDPGVYVDNMYGPFFPYALAFGLWL